MKKIPKTLWFALAAFVAIVTIVVVVIVSVIKLGSDVKISPEFEGDFCVAKYESVGDVAVTKKQFEVLKGIVEDELESQVVSDYKVSYNEKKQIITVKFTDDEYNDPQEISKCITDALCFNGGKLTFRDESGKVLLENSHIKNATTQPDNYSVGNYCIAIELNDKGAEKFAGATAANIGKQILIYMDEQLLCAPFVQETIASGLCTITGNFTKQDAEMITKQIIADEFSAEFKLSDLEY